MLKTVCLFWIVSDYLKMLGIKKNKWAHDTKWDCIVFTNINTDMREQRTF